MTKNHDIIEISAEVLHETEKAILIKNLKDEDIWLPKSMIDYDGDVEIQLPEWLAEEKELI